MLEHNVTRLKKNKKLQLTYEVGRDLSEVYHWPENTDFPTRKQVYSLLGNYINGKADAAFNKKHEKAAAHQKKAADNERRSKYRSNPPV